MYLYLYVQTIQHTHAHTMRLKHMVGLVGAAQAKERHIDRSHPPGYMCCVTFYSKLKHDQKKLKKLKRWKSYLLPRR